MNGKPPKRLSESALKKLKEWRWPGNIRELENVIERAVLMSTADEISADDLGYRFGSASALPRPEDSAISIQAGSAETFAPGMTISEAERRLIMKTLEYTNQNRTRAAQMLGISIRTLRNKLHEYGVARGGWESQGEERADG